METTVYPEFDDVCFMRIKDQKPLRVVELFAGVGGFRIGLEGYPKKSSPYQVVWSNQWEPATRAQHASEIYVQRFGPEGHSNQDISTVDVKDIPDHDILVGGFPCQDYSVARTLSHADGIIGKKGVLWWQIARILYQKENKTPSYLILENVDRLLKSPAKHRGRDFALMLASLSDLGYIVEWRVINAADYGMPQRRRRVFILGYHKRTNLHKMIRKQENISEWLFKSGVVGKAFPTDTRAKDFEKSYEIKGSLPEISKKFEMVSNAVSPFENSGIMIDRKVYTEHVTPKFTGKPLTLKDIIEDEDSVSEEFYLNDKDLRDWKYLKGPKNEPRRSSSGHVYQYSEGGMSFPDPLEKPGRTIITGEGGTAPSRFKHVIKPNGRYRRLTPLELERLNMFPDNFTAGAHPVKRAFFMGNALVVGIVEKLGESLYKKIQDNECTTTSKR